MTKDEDLHLGGLEPALAVHAAMIPFRGNFPNISEDASGGVRRFLNRPRQRSQDGPFLFLYVSKR
jgi:hypothetical protein